MSNFAYSVAIRLTVTNLASQGIRMLGKDLLTAHGNAVKLEDKLRALKMIAVGYGMEKMGQGILGFMGKSIDASKEYTHQLALMNAAGATQKEIAQSTAAAWQTSRTVRTSSATDNLSTLRELRTVFFGRMNEAYSVLPQVQRATAILQSLSGQEQHNVGFDMVKAIERRSTGNVTGAQLQTNTDLMTRAFLGMSGTINANDFHQALSKAKLSALTLNDDFIYKYLPTLMQINKGGGGGGAQQAGTQIATAARAIVQGRMLKSMYPIWEEMGLIRAGDIVHNAGGSTSLKPGAVKGAALFQASPYDWANTILGPAVAAYSAKHHMSGAQTILSMFSDRNASNLFGSFILQAAHFARDRQLIESVGTTKQGYDKLMKTDPQLAQQAVQAQWQNLLAIIGFQILPKILPVMVKFAGTLSDIGNALYSHPIRTEVAVMGLTAIGGALDVMGKVMMTAGIIKFLGIGPIITGTLVPIGVAVGATFIGIGAAAWLVYNNWKEIKGSLVTMWSDIKTGFRQLFNGDILGAWATFKHAMLLGWQTFFNTLIAGLDAILPSAMAIGKFHFADPAGPNVAPPGGKPVVIHTHTHLGPKEIAHAVTPYLISNMAKQAGRPSQGKSTFDFSRSYVPPSAMSR